MPHPVQHFDKLCANSEKVKLDCLGHLNQNDQAAIP